MQLLDNIRREKAARRNVLKQNILQSQKEADTQTERNHQNTILQLKEVDTMENQEDRELMAVAGILPAGLPRINEESPLDQ